MEQSMRQLVERAGAGDQQAVTALYEQTNRKAYYLALQLVKDQDQAQDILQDAYLKVFTNLHMLQQPENFQGWLDTIVINKSKDYLKKKKPVLFSHMAAENETDAEPDFEDESGYFSPEKQVDYAETKRLVQEMIDRLPEQQRMAVVLYYLENLSVGQIARMMECSEGTVKSRLNYGRKAIKEQVLALEKKGTKLYCMPLVPFLYWMFRQQVLAAVVPGAVGSAVVAGGAAGAGNAAGVGAAGAGAAGAGNAAGAGAAGAGNAAGAGAAGAGNAAGAGMAGAGGAGTAAAGKAGLAVLGKAMGVKGIAIVAAACVGVGAGAAGGVYAVKSHRAAEAAKVEAKRADEARSGVQREREQAETVDDGASLTDENREADRIKAAWTPQQQRIWEAALYTAMDERVAAADLGKEPGTLSQKSRNMFLEASHSITTWGLMTEAIGSVNRGGYSIYDKDTVDQIIEECFGYPLEEYVAGTDQTLILLKDNTYWLSGGDWGTMWPYKEIAGIEVRDDRLCVYGYKGWETDLEENANVNYKFDSDQNTWIFKEPLVMEFSYHPDATYSFFRLEDIHYNRDWESGEGSDPGETGGLEEIPQMEAGRYYVADILVQGEHVDFEPDLTYYTITALTNQEARMVCHYENKDSEEVYTKNEEGEYLRPMKDNFAGWFAGMSFDSPTQISRVRYRPGADGGLEEDVRWVYRAGEAPRTGAAEVSEQQKHVMELLLSPLVYAKVPENGIVRTADLSPERIVNLMEGHLNDIMEDPAESIFSPLAEAGTHSVEQGLVYQYIEDMYGQPVSEKAVEKELSREVQFLKLEDGRLSVTGASGEAWCGVTLEDFSMENGKLSAKGIYRIELGDETMGGQVQAVFEVNHGSFFGYTLESVEVTVVKDGN